MPLALRVPFGLKDDQLYEPGQVLNGKACGCVCPACKRDLVAKQKATTPHFAHAPGEDCAKALETAVHLAAKQLIAKRLELRLPEVKFFNFWAPKFGVETICEERVAKLDSVAVEIWLDDMRPDLLATIDGEKYLVEIAVTHYVDEVKYKKIQAHKIPTIEIDAAGLKKNFTFAALEDLLFTSAYPATWLYHPRPEELAQEALRQYQAEEERKVVELRTRRERFENYRDMPAQEKLARHCRKLGLTSTQLNELTTFVAWEKSFGVPRAVWQSAVLVYLANEEQTHGWEEFLGLDIHLEDCLDWLRKIFSIMPEVNDGEKIALWKYFRFLETLNIVKHFHNDCFHLQKPSKRWIES
jgi:hypothetical protein